MGASVRRVSDAERRARIGAQRLLEGTPAHLAAEAVTKSLVAIHATDPASTILAVVQRVLGTTVEDVETALYERRSVVRVVGMRRTLFAVGDELAPSVWISSRHTVARPQRRLLERLVGESGIASDPVTWIGEAEARLLRLLEGRPGVTSRWLAESDEMLGRRLVYSSVSPNAPGDTSVASRLLTVLSAEGRVVRGRPVGGWTSSQFTWVLPTVWRSDWTPHPDSEESADRTIVDRWLRRYAPATTDDLSWWTGWSKARVRGSLDALGAVPVRLECGDGWLHPATVDPAVRSAPWIAMLPALDSTTMGWREREFYLGSYGPRVFDDVGNAGPTIWADGRVIGGWAQLDNGTVAYQLFEDIGYEHTLAVAEAAGRLEGVIADVRLKPRARRWTSTEKQLRGSA